MASDDADEGVADQLLNRLQQLEAEVAALRATLAEEVRTRRVIVATERGSERARIEASDDVGSVRVRVGPEGAGQVSAEVFALAPQPVDGDGAEAGVVLAVGGDVVAHWTVLAPPGASAGANRSDDGR
ncbi:MAG: hypothetical protein AAGK32_01945 [Actinomycetota bacterium]